MESFRLIPGQLAAGEENFAVNSGGDAAKEKKLIRCDLCGRTVNSQSQAEAHFQGLYHLSRMQAQGLPLPPGTDLDKLRLYNIKVMKAMKSPVRHLVAGPNFYSRRAAPAVFDVHVSGLGMPVTAIPPPTGMPHAPAAPSIAPPPPPPSALVNSYAMNQTYNPIAHGRSRSVMCEICGVVTNSTTQAQSHLNGRKHLTRLAELGMPVPQDVAVDFLEASLLSMRQNKIGYEVPKMTMYERFAPRIPQQFPTPRYQCSQTNGPQIPNCRSTATGSSYRDGQSRGPNCAVRARTLVPCETCQLLFNSQEQAQAHFNGGKHQKRLRMINFYRRNIEKAQVQSSSSRQIVCPVCSTSVNSSKQMDAHIQGKVHKSKLEQKTIVVPNEVDRVVVSDVGADGDRGRDEILACKINSVTCDLANCVPSPSPNSNLYHEQHFSRSELEKTDESATGSAAAAATVSVAEQTV